MNFLAPAAFGLGLLLPLIVLLYLLKLRRVERRVSSTYLWRRMVRDLEANAPWQRLRKNLLLLLQLLFLITLILALTRPYLWSDEFSGDSAIIIVDTSASMAATDVAPSRLENAKEQIGGLVGRLPSDVPVTLITAGLQARVLTASSLDRRQIQQTIAEIKNELGGSDMQTALQLADAIAARQPQTAISIYTDGGVNLPGNLTARRQSNIVLIGSAGDNQAISLMQLETPINKDERTAFLQLLNYSDQEARRRLIVTVDSAPFETTDMVIAPRGEASLLVEGIPPQSEIVEAQLLPGNSALDYLPLDDIAYAINRQQEPLQVNLVSSGNRFVETAIGLLPGVTLTRTDPASTGQLPVADVTVIDAALPITTTLPAGNLFFINPIRSTEFFSVTGQLENPRPIPASRDLELMKYISLKDINILDAAQIPLPDYAEALIVAENAGAQSIYPLLFVGESHDRRLAVMAFSLQHSDLPLQVAFPLLMANLIQFLTPHQLYDLPTQAQPGNAVVINLPLDSDGWAAAQSIAITRPNGMTTQFEALNGQVAFADTTQAGVYTVSTREGVVGKFAVTPFSSQESEIRLQELSLAAREESQGIPGSTQSSRREWWRWFAMLALMLLTLEWLVYQRPSLAFLAGKIRGLR